MYMYIANSKMFVNFQQKYAYELICISIMNKQNQLILISFSK